MFELNQILTAAQCACSMNTRGAYMQFFTQIPRKLNAWREERHGSRIILQTWPGIGSRTVQRIEEREEGGPYESLSCFWRPPSMLNVVALTVDPPIRPLQMRS